MRTIYVILAAAGWAWFVLAMTYLWVRLGRAKRARSRFDGLTTQDEKQH